MVGRMLVRCRAATRLLPGSRRQNDHADVIAAQVIHASLHLTDLERAPLPRRARTRRGLLGAGTRGMTCFLDYGSPQKRWDIIDAAFAAAQVACPRTWMHWP